MTDGPGDTKRVFGKPFTQQEPIPEAAIERAVEVMRGGRLHRYNTVEGETAEAASGPTAADNPRVTRWKERSTAR